MSPRMRTQSAGRPVAESLRGGSGKLEGNDQGLGANGGVEGNVEGVNGGVGGAPDFSTIIAQQLQNLLPVMLAQEYDGKGGVVVLTRWIEKMEYVHDMSGCSVDQKVEYTAGSFVGKALTWWNSQIRTLNREADNHVMVGAGHAAYTDRFHELARLVPHLVTPEQKMLRDQNHARGREFMLGVEEARQDLNIVTGTFTLNNPVATTLFDSGADYSFVFTTFIPLLGLEPSDLGFRYEIEIASGQLVEIDKVIKGCKLGIEGRVFDIYLIPFRHGSLDVIVAGDKKQEEIVVVRDFPEVFPDDLSGLPPIQEIKFRIELTPGAMLVAKSPYRVTPSELEELSGQIKEL
ncbi:hypothetical protein Tco_1146295 [Tanacetum coccineum]